MHTRTRVPSDRSFHLGPWLFLAAAPFAVGCEPAPDVAITTEQSALRTEKRTDADDPRDLVKLWRTKIEPSAELPGTFGSGLAYDKKDGLYWMVTDKASGLTSWPLNLMRVKIAPHKAEVVSVIPLTENGVPLTGADMDPEDVTVAPDGSLWLCDENRPYLLHVSRRGAVLARVEPPANLLMRVNNQGLEGLAISHDGDTVYAILQSGLQTEPDKLNTILLAYDVASGTFTQHAYRLDSPSAYDYPAVLPVAVKMGANGLAMVGRNALYVIERDNQSGIYARNKRVYRIEVPATPSATPLAKSLVVDLAALGYTWEKLEGIAVFNRNRLVVSNDNDAVATIPTEFWQLQF